LLETHANLPSHVDEAHVIVDLLAEHEVINTQFTTLQDLMVRDRTCSETASTSICRQHRREPKKDSTSRIHTITVHDLGRIEDEDENKSSLRVNRIWSVQGRLRG